MMGRRSRRRRRSPPKGKSYTLMCIQIKHTSATTFHPWVMINPVGRAYAPLRSSLIAIRIIAIDNKILKQPDDYTIAAAVKRLRVIIDENRRENGAILMMRLITRGVCERASERANGEFSFENTPPRQAHATKQANIASVSLINLAGIGENNEPYRRPPFERCPHTAAVLLRLYEISDIAVFGKGHSFPHRFVIVLMSATLMLNAATATTATTYRLIGRFQRQNKRRSGRRHYQ